MSWVYNHPNASVYNRLIMQKLSEISTAILSIKARSLTPAQFKEVLNDMLNPKEETVAEYLLIDVAKGPISYMRRCTVLWFMTYLLLCISSVMRR